MIKKLTISLVRKTTFDGPWTLTIDSVEQGEKYPNTPVLDCLTKCGTFDGAGPITNAIYFLPEALKAMGITEAGSEGAYPTQNATEAKADPIAPARAIVDEYNKAMEKLADKAKKEIVHGPEAVYVPPKVVL